MTELRRMIAQTSADREWFRRQAVVRGTGSGDGFRHHPAMSIDAAACAIRERALLDALAAIERERGP